MSDRNGAWPTEIHNTIIAEAFQGLGEYEVGIIQKASYDTDYNNPVAAIGPDGQTHMYDPQSPEASFVHSMRDGVHNQSVADATKESDDFIAANEHKASRLQAEWKAAGHEGMCPEALKAFGNALHTIEDRNSPAHAGFQPWFGTDSVHGFFNAMIHVSREGSITAQQLRYAEQVAIQEFEKTFGNPTLWDGTEEPGCVTTQGPSGAYTTCTTR